MGPAGTVTGGPEGAEKRGKNRAGARETNCFWCTSVEVARERFLELKAAGLEGVLVSANPFVVEHVPFDRVEKGVAAALEVFGERGTLVYHPVYLRALGALGVRGTLKFEDYERRLLELDQALDRKSTRLNSSHSWRSRMPSSA